MVAIYARGQRIFVVRQAAGAGVRIDMAPVFPASRDPRSLAAALAGAFEPARQDDPAVQSPDLRRYRSPVLDAAGVGSIAALERGLSYCTLAREAGGLRVQPYRRHPAGRGFEPAGPAIDLPPRQPPEETAARILELLGDGNAPGPG
jgi:hypothetical protein